VKKQILIVDDDQRVLDALRRALRERDDDWSLTFVTNPETAWQSLLDATYDAVVSDVKMPNVSGLELLQRMRQTEKTKDVPVVMLTGVDDQSLKEKALDCGADDLLNKPIEAGQLAARLRNVLEKKAYEDDLRSKNELLMERIRRQNAELAQSRLSIVCRLGMAAEFRDEATGNHVIRVGCYSRAVAAAMGLPRSCVETLLVAAPLHDIGKIGIPDSVLLKPGPLTDEEWVIMQRHCEIGERILRERSKSVIPLFDWYSVEFDSIRDVLESHDPVLDMAATVALTHHEKWDGSGYPQRLSGEAIPLESRIVAIADVFDALVSTRPYRPARPEEEALTIIDATVGSHFDPHVHEAFVRALPEIRAIHARFDDSMGIVLQPEGAIA
jgi:putative two-component system response regulator